MTTLHNKPRSTQPTPSDAVVELMARAIARQFYGENWELMGDEFMPEAKAILSALSGAGLAVLPLEATEEMLREVARNPATQVRQLKVIEWQMMAAAFHPSQLEKTDGHKE